MNGMTLLKALNNIDDRFIQEAASIDIGKTDDVRKLKKSNIIKYMVGMAAMAAAVVLITVGIQRKDTDVQDENMVGVVNPYVYYDTLAEAEKAVGFEITVPECFDDVKISEIIVIAGETIEIDYGEDKQSAVTIRKAKGSDDISGDYNTYGFERILSIADMRVTVKGDDDLIKLLTWQNGDFTYSMCLPMGMTEKQVMEIIPVIE